MTFRARVRRRGTSVAARHPGQSGLCLEGRPAGRQLDDVFIQVYRCARLCQFKVWEIIVKAVLLMRLPGKHLLQALSRDVQLYYEEHQPLKHRQPAWHIHSVWLSAPQLASIPVPSPCLRGLQWFRRFLDMPPLWCLLILASGAPGPSNREGGSFC